MCDFFSRGVWEANVEDAFAVARRHINSMIDRLEDVWLDQVSLAKYAYAGSVSIEYVAVLDELCKLNLGHLHQAIHLMLGPFEVLNAECVDGNVSDTGLVAHFEYLATCQQMFPSAAV